MSTFVSVIIATRNRAALLGRTLDALAAQHWPVDRYEVVVADNGSTDGTAAVVEAAARRTTRGAIRYLHEARPGKSHAVNAALAIARGDVLAFTDDDVRPRAEWLVDLVKPFDDAGVDFVAGRVLPEWEAAPPRWVSPALFGVLAIPDGGAMPLTIRLGANEHVMPIGANMAVRASVVQRLGGLRRDLGKLEGTLRTGEDHEFFLRLLHNGHGGAYAPAAVVSHLVPRERLRRSYFRKWLFQNGQDVAKLEQTYRRPARRLLSIPRYLWRDMARAACTAIASVAGRDPARRFAATVRIIWIAGYVREAWFGRAADAVPDFRIVRQAARLG